MVKHVRKLTELLQRRTAFVMPARYDSPPNRYWCARCCWTVHAWVRTNIGWADGYFRRPDCVLVSGHRDLRSRGITDCPVTAM